MVKASIDNGSTEEGILARHTEPHLYTAVIKAYLRELPDPLFCSDFAPQWSAANSIRKHKERMKEINRILDNIPIENRRNIDFLFKFLAQLNEDEAANKMSISNLIIVLGPNLLWERGTQA